MNASHQTLSQPISRRNTLSRDVSPLFEVSRRSAWKERLMTVLCRYCGCTFVAKRGAAKSTEYYLVGSQSAMNMARILWNHLSSYIHKSATKDLAGIGRVAINSYCLGYVEGLKDSARRAPSAIRAEFNAREANHHAALNYNTVQHAECDNFTIDNHIFAMGKMSSASFDLGNFANGMF